MLIRNKSQVNKDLLDSLGKEEFCDVKIEAQDGEIAASKLILSIRSEYFSGMLIENSTGRIKLPYPLVVVERVITYLYCGEMDGFEQMEGMKDKNLGKVLDLMELLKLMNLSEEFKEVESNALDLIKNDYFYEDTKAKDILNILDKAVKMGMARIVKALMSCLLYNIDVVVTWDSEEIGGLSEDLLIKLLEVKDVDVEGDLEEEDNTYFRFRAFVEWLAVNWMTADKKVETIKAMCNLICEK